MDAMCAGALTKLGSSSSFATASWAKQNGKCGGGQTPITRMAQAEAGNEGNDEGD